MFDHELDWNNVSSSFEINESYDFKIVNRDVSLYSLQIWHRVEDEQL